MGLYTSLRFKGVVKENFRNGFEKIAMRGEWNESADNILKKFGEEDPRAEFIPCGALNSAPDEWVKGPYDEYGNGMATDGFERSYNEKTGKWAFQCSVIDYNCTIQSFFDLVPYFMESVEIAEVFYEEWTYSKSYELVDKKMQLANPIYKCYR